MAVVKKRATIRRVATTPPTYAYVFEPIPYTGEDAEVADDGNTLTQAYNEVGALAGNLASFPPGTVIPLVTITVEYKVPDA